MTPRPDETASRRAPHLIPLAAREPGELRLGEIVARFPGAASILRTLGIDYWSEGRLTLAEACERRAVDPESLWERIEAAPAPSSAPVSWDERSTAEVIDYIIDQYHTPLVRMLPRLHVALREARKLFRPDQRAAVDGLVSFFARLRQETEVHLFKEEQVLFPRLRAGQMALALGPIHLIRREHELEAEQLAELARRVRLCRAPDGEREAWDELVHDLRTFLAAQKEHMHLENNVLFERAWAHS